MSTTSAEQRSGDQGGILAIRRYSLLAFGGAAFSLVAGALHPGSEPPNNHAAVFAEYAASSTWTAVHLAQFVGMALLIGGLVGVLDAIRRTNQAQAPDGLIRLSTVLAGLALALYAVLQAVDGVALKQAVDAWAAAPAAERTARFATAEVVRWLEWGARSYQSFVFGSALAVAGYALYRSRNDLRVAGVLMAGSGLAYVAQGWVLGVEGFSNANTLPTLAGYVLVFGWTIASAAAAHGILTRNGGPQGVGTAQSGLEART